MKRQTVVVSAGTYHLPFNRLVDWLQPWTSAHPQVRIIMQHGPGVPLSGAENHTLIPYPDLMDLYQAADAIVLQGGAGGVMDMRKLDRIPIVVPRIPIENEVVDDHQLLFTERLAALGIVTRVLSQQDLWISLDAALDGSLSTHRKAGVPTPGVANVTELLRALPQTIGWGGRHRRIGQSTAGAFRRH